MYLYQYHVLVHYSILYVYIICSAKSSVKEAETHGQRVRWCLVRRRRYPCCWLPHTCKRLHLQSGTVWWWSALGRLLDRFYRPSPACRSACQCCKWPEEGRPRDPSCVATRSVVSEFQSPRSWWQLSHRDRLFFLWVEPRWSSAELTRRTIIDTALGDIYKAKTTNVLQSTPKNQQ